MHSACQDQAGNVTRRTPDGVWGLHEEGRSAATPPRSLTCPDDGCLWLCGQQAQRVKIAVVQHVVLKVFQRQGWFKKLPVTVIGEVVVNEQSRVSEKIKLIVPGRRRKRLKENE